MSTPSQIGPYRVEGLLGQGGAGAVYACQHPEHGSVAVKVLRGQGSLDSHRHRLEREVRALRQLRHPGVVEILDAGLVGGLPWFAMRRVTGRSLEQRLREEGPLAVSEVTEIAAQLAHALGFVHAAGLLHRDLKPDNVLWTPEGRVVLTDFGLVKDLEIAASRELSKSGAIQGTPGYWAPEQARGQANRATASTDVYGLGATLYALLSGVPPAQGSSFMEVVIATLEREPPPLAQFRGDAPAWLCALVHRCLAKDPSERFATMREVEEALEVRQRPARSRGALVASGLVLATLLTGLALALARVGGATLADHGTRGSPASSGAVSPGGESPPGDVAAGLGARTASSGADPPRSSRDEERRRATQLLDEGRGPEARALLEPLGAAGDVAAMGLLGTAVFQGKIAGISLEEARDLLRRAAEGDDLKGTYNYGVALSQGLGGPVDAAGALRAFERAAARGHPGAASNLAGWYERGQSVAKDEAKARALYARAAELGAGAAYGLLALMVNEGRGGPPDQAEAHRLALAGAALEDPFSLLVLSRLERSGEGTPVDHQAGLDHALRAAELGLVEAMFDAGRILALGQGVAPDLPQGLAWLELASGRGHAFATTFLGDMFYLGLGVGRDLGRAVTYYERCLELGEFLEARTILGKLYRTGGPGVNRDPARGLAHLRRAAAAGHGEAEGELGVALCAEGEVEEGLALLERSAARGVEESRVLLALQLVHLGRRERGLPLLEAAAARGSAQARLQLARLLRLEEPSPAALARAFELTRLAAEGGDREAMHDLGICYGQGLGCPRDERLGLEWHRKAAIKGQAESQFVLAATLQREAEAQGDSAARARAYREARGYYERAAAGGVTRALVVLGLFHAQGLSGPANLVAAVELFAQAHARGDRLGAHLLGSALVRGEGVARDVPRGVALLRIVASEAHPDHPGLPERAQALLEELEERGLLPPPEEAPPPPR